MMSDHARKSLLALLAALAFALSWSVRAQEEGDEGVSSPKVKVSNRRSRQRVENPMFGYTHMQASPYTIQGGRLVLGTEIAFGLTDFLQIGTGVVRDLFKIYNANARMSLIDFPEFALALTYGFEHYNLKDISSLNPNITYTTHQPGAVTAYSLGSNLALFVGGNLNFTNIQINSDSVPTRSGFIRGAVGGSDLSWSYSSTQRKFGNVVSVGTTYDFSYKIYGIGLSHHWPGFKIGVHYYPNAKENKLLPLISGGAVVDL